MVEPIFDRGLIRRNRSRISLGFLNHSFLFDWTKNEISDRLNDVTRDFDVSLEIGSRGSIVAHPKILKLFTMDLAQLHCVNNSNFIQGSEEFLPFAQNSLDLIISTLNLHFVNDLPGALLQIRKSLKADGLFLAAMLGGETLHELRACLNEAELLLLGGLSPRVAPFADKPQMAGLLQRAGFSLPVVDSEIITVTYDSIFKLMHDLRGMGETNSMLARHKQFATKSLFLEAAKLYQERFSEADGRIRATFEVIFLLGWSPHHSQQKPLRPGSADVSLKDILESPYND